MQFVSNHLTFKFISLPKTIENLNDQLVLKVDKEDSLNIKQTTGYIRTLQEFNYEQIKEMNVSISACIRSTNTCFRQKAILRVVIINRNDNEPKLPTRNQ